MILSFNNYLINEWNKKDRLMILSNDISNQFTVAFEFELETDDKKNRYNDDLEEIYELVKKRLLIRLKTEIFYKEELNFINNIFDELYNYIIEDDIENIDELLDQKNYKNKNHKIIIQLLFYEWNLYSNDDLNYLTNNVKKYLPNFYNKYNNELKFELDASLNRGIEFSPIKYNDGINESIEMLEYFFNDFTKQKYWKFSERTGLHINLGIKNAKSWNPIKGMLNINDISSKTYAFKNIEYRIPISHCQSIMKELKQELIINNIKLNIKNQNLENYLNDKLRKLLLEKGYKHYAFNILHIEENNYVEFRYVGGVIDKNLIIEKTLFFAYITYLMTHENYNKISYQKKLYKFVETINDSIIK